MGYMGYMGYVGEGGVATKLCCESNIQKSNGAPMLPRFQRAATKLLRY